MRTFTLGSGADRKFVVLEIEGARVSIIEGQPDGRTKRKDKQLNGEAEAQAAHDRLINELFARGFVEKRSRIVKRPKIILAEKSEPDDAPFGPGGIAAEDLYDLDDGIAAEEDARVLPRLGPPAEVDPVDDPGPKKATKKAGARKKKRKRKAEGRGDELDKRIVGLAIGIGLALVGVVGFLVWEAALKPPSIVGIWQGSRLDFETGGPMSFSQYRLVLDERKHASMTLQQEINYAGTYALKGKQLTLNLIDEEGESVTQEYKVALGRATLDLFDPRTDKKVVQLTRLHEKPPSGGGSAPPPPPAPSEVASAGDAGADARLASVEFAPKDNAFKVRHPPGWDVETGARPDNSYSWARFTKSPGKIQVFADVAGSLMAGAPNQGQFEEGSELAPVHGAHLQYKRTASEMYGDYKESEPALFKGSRLGEGRIATFHASGGGLFGSKIKGYRVTLLTNDRRISILCECPEKQFSKLEPTFLAVCRSLAR